MATPATGTNELPSSPDSITKENTTQSSITIKWIKACGNITQYTIQYCEENEVSKDNWKTEATDGDETYLKVDSLKPATSYYFKIRADGINGSSDFSSVMGPISTKERLAIRILAESELVDEGKVSKIYQIKGNGVVLDNKSSSIKPRKRGDKQRELRLCKVSIGKPRAEVKKEKVLMVVGATGAGKTTLINGMINYIFGVNISDSFRLKLVTESAGSQAQSQTSDITAYTIHCMEDAEIDYNLTIIDTPGFGDTSGLARDKEITSQIKDFFAHSNGVSHLDGIGFVAQASLARLTQTQQYIFDSILSIFGKDVEKNIFMMVTFADGQKPPVMAAVKEAKVPYAGSFKFNNSAIFTDVDEDDEDHSDDSDGEDRFDETFWKMGMNSFKRFFSKFKAAESVSLRLTRDVLELRECLETNILGLQDQMKVCLSKLEVLSQEKTVLKEREKDIAMNKNFTYEVEVPDYKREKTKKDEFVTNCLRCSRTCHKSCIYSDDDKKKWCSAMNNRGKENASCKICDGCHWQEHKNTGERIIPYIRIETRTLDHLKSNYTSALKGKKLVEAMLLEHQRQLERAHALLHNTIEESQRCLTKLGEIALKPNPLTQVQYIELLIASEKQQAEEGFMTRVKYLEATKEQAEFLEIMRDANDADKRIAEEEQKKEDGWEKRVETLMKMRRIKSEVEEIRNKRKRQSRGVWGTLKAALGY